VRYDEAVTLLLHHTKVWLRVIVRSNRKDLLRSLGIREEAGKDHNKAPFIIVLYLKVVSGRSVQAIRPAECSVHEIYPSPQLDHLRRTRSFATYQQIRCAQVELA
jgi:hypothetical protein